MRRALYLTLLVAGNLYAQNYDTNNIVVQIFAGSGNSGSADGNGIFTSFSDPTALAADAADNIFVCDGFNYGIRRINPNRDVVTIAGRIGAFGDADGVGTDATFSSISGMCVDGSGNLILACGSSIRKMTPTTKVLTMAGSFLQIGYTNGPGSIARFRNAAGVCVSQGMIFVADSSDHRIRKITVPQEEPVQPSSLSVGRYSGVTIAGKVGRAYRIEATPDCQHTNEGLSVATIALPQTPYLWIDTNSAGIPQRFYRAVLLP